MLPRRRSSNHNLLLHSVLKTGEKDEAISATRLQRFYLSWVAQPAYRLYLNFAKELGNLYLNKLQKNSK